MIYVYTVGDGMIMDVNGIYKVTQGGKVEAMQSGGMYMKQGNQEELINTCLYCSYIWSNSCDCNFHCYCSSINCASTIQMWDKHWNEHNELSWTHSGRFSIRSVNCQVATHNGMLQGVVNAVQCILSKALTQSAAFFWLLQSGVLQLQCRQPIGLEHPPTQK